MPSEINLRMGAREWAILLLLSVLWGGSFFFIDVAVESVAPFTLVLLRVLLGAATLLLVLQVTGQGLPFERRTIGPFLGPGRGHGPTWSAWPSRPSRPASAGPAPPSAGAGPAAPAWP